MGMYVPTRDTTSSARIVPIFPGRFPPMKFPKKSSSPLLEDPLSAFTARPREAGHDRARLGDGSVIRVARVIPVSHPMALLPSPSGSHVCPSAPMPGRFITAEFTTARVMTERAGRSGRRAAANDACARAPRAREVSARTGPYPILTLRASRRPRSAPGPTARDPSDIAGVVAMLLDKAMRAAHCGRGRATRSARRRAATSHETRLVPSPTWRRSSSSAHANSLTGCDAADETCSRDCFLSVRVKATIPIAFSRRLLQKISAPSPWGCGRGVASAMASTSVPSGSPVIPAAAALWKTEVRRLPGATSHDELAKLTNDIADFSLRVPGQLQAALRELLGGGGERGVRALRRRARARSTRIREVTVAASRVMEKLFARRGADLRLVAPMPRGGWRARASRLAGRRSRRAPRTTDYFTRRTQRARSRVLTRFSCARKAAKRRTARRRRGVMTATLESALRKGTLLSTISSTCAPARRGETRGKGEPHARETRASRTGRKALEETRAMLESCS